ncbi:hypothetical protein BDZ89DRAFT_150691 [Hymenopellis radicata]|nr:hypothetical protein BDZ89DRAFT_150691 [Hymenopellis radicata]
MPKQLEMHSWPALLPSRDIPMFTLHGNEPLRQMRMASMLLALNLSFASTPWKTSSAQIPHALRPARSTHQTKPISFFTLPTIYISQCHVSHFSTLDAHPTSTTITSRPIKSQNRRPPWRSSCACAIPSISTPWNGSMAAILKSECCRRWIRYNHRKNSFFRTWSVQHLAFLICP